MQSPRVPHGNIHDLNDRLRRDFEAVAESWRNTRADWKDATADRFADDHLDHFRPVLTRLTTSLAELSETLSRAEVALRDDAGDALR